MKSYLEWLLLDHKAGKIKFALFLLGIAQCALLTDDLYQEYIYSDMPLSVLILGYIAMYGFTISIGLQPYTIYRRLFKK